MRPEGDKLAFTKLEKIEQELVRARDKLSVWQGKVRDLEQRKQEEENTRIVGMVRAVKLTPSQLAELLKQPGIFSLPDPGEPEKEKEDHKNEE